MDSHRGFVERLEAFSPPAWAQLPDLGLYMDQVITYLERQYGALYGGQKKIITPAMINNYVKAGVVGRPTGKKYERPQIAQLMMLCMLKQSLSLDEMKQLLSRPEQDGLEALYTSFCEMVESARLVLTDTPDAPVPMHYAILAAAYQLRSKDMLRSVKEVKA